MRLSRGGARGGEEESVRPPNDKALAVLTRLIQSFEDLECGVVSEW